MISLWKLLKNSLSAIKNLKRRRTKKIELAASWFLKLWNAIAWSKEKIFYRLAAINGTNILFQAKEICHRCHCLCDMSHNSIFLEITFQCQKAIWLTSYPPLCVTICHCTCSWRKEVWIWRPSNTLAINCKFTKKNPYHICLNCNSNIWQDIILSGIFHRGAVPPRTQKK